MGPLALLCLERTSASCILGPSCAVLSTRKTRAACTNGSSQCVCFGSSGNPQRVNLLRMCSCAAGFARCKCHVCGCKLNAVPLGADSVSRCVCFSCYWQLAVQKGRNDRATCGRYLKDKQELAEFSHFCACSCMCVGEPRQTRGASRAVACSALG